MSLLLPTDTKLHIDGHCEMMLLWNELTALPDNLFVGGDLSVQETGVAYLPKNMKVGGGLYFTDSNYIKSISDITVNGNMDFAYCQALRELKGNIIVNGNLDLSHDGNIASLSDDLNVGGDVILTGSRIKSEQDIPNIAKIKPNIGGKIIF